MLVLNIVVAEAVVFTLLVLFAQQRRDALVACRPSTSGRRTSW